MDIKESITAQLQQDHGIDPEITSHLWNEGLFGEIGSRRFLIRKDFREKRRPRMRHRVRGVIARKYGVSFPLVEYYTKDL